MNLPSPSSNSRCRLKPTFPRATVALLAASLAGPAAWAAEAPAGKTAPSTTLLNDWLRAQSPEFKAWDLGGQIRFRYEDKPNAGTFPNADFIAAGPANDDEFILFRERLHLGYQPESWLKFYVEAQDASGYWDERTPSPNTDVFDLQQAYLQWGDGKKCPFSLKLGRQELVYGDERFVGRGDWSNTGRVFDAIKLRAEGSAGWVDGFTSHVVVPYDDHFNESNDEDWFSGVYAATRRGVPWQETQVYCLVRNYSAAAADAIAPGVPGSPKTARDIVTFGTLWKSLPGKLGGWDYSLEVAGQLGTVNSGGVRRDQRSYAVFASGGYTLTKAWASPRLGIGYEHGSGDSNPNDGTVETFENVFGTQHRPYGQMDLFGARNMHIPKLSLTAKPAKNFTVGVDYLWFILADPNDYLYPESGSGRSGNGYGIHPGYDAYVGSELDLVGTYTFKNWGVLQAGYGHFFVGEYVTQSVGSVPANGGTTDADWFFAQVTFNF